MKTRNKTLPIAIALAVGAAACPFWVRAQRVQVRSAPRVSFTPAVSPAGPGVRLMPAPLGIPSLLPVTPAPQAGPSAPAPTGTEGMAAALVPLSRALEALPGATEKRSGEDIAGDGARIEEALTGRTLAGPRGEAVGTDIDAEVKSAAQAISALKAEIGRVIVGQGEMVEAIITGLIAGEHILLEGVPGVAKTLAVRAFSDATEASFQRIQGTPDKLPSDIVGAEILQEDPQTGVRALRHEPGPIFANIVLVDEINRMMPKTQAALMEAMQERQVTIGRQTLVLPTPFLVLATQNPIEQEGTYPLPEAQQDRFLLKVLVKRPTQKELQEIMERFSKGQAPKAAKEIDIADLARLKDVAERVEVRPALMRYITDIVEATHNPAAYGLDFKGAIANGASPRAGLAILKAARIRALAAGRSYVTDQDVKDVVPAALRHRILLNYSKVTVEQIIEGILDHVGVTS